MQISLRRNLLNKALLVAILAVFVSSASTVFAQTACDSLTGNFTYTNTGNAYTFTSAKEPASTYNIWTMGDGQSRTGNPVNYTYATNAQTVTYTVCHIVYLTNNTKCKRDTLCQQVTVPGTGTCNSKFSYSIGTGGSVTFTNESTSSDSIIQYSWVFGAGYPVSYLKNPTNVYTASGTYGVCLGITTRTGCTSEWCDTITVTITKSSCDSLSAYYDYTDTGDVYHFFDPYNQNPNGYHALWEFGDGSNAATGLPITHTFPASKTAITYNVCEYVYLPNSTCKTDTFCRSITVPATIFPPCDSITASYTYTAGTGSGVDAYTFTSAHNPSGVRNNWNFGDGTTGSGSPVNHTFPSSPVSKEYTVCQYVYYPGSTCKTDTFCNQIIVAAKTPCDSLNAYYDYTDTGDVYHFSDPYLTNPKGYVGFWKFGDGTSANAGIPEAHTFPTSTIAETYTVCFYVSLPNSSCPSDSFCRSITVAATTAPCNVKANYTYSVGTNGSVSFTDESTGGATSWNWSFGDGSNSSVQSPTHVFASSGKYDVCLRAGLLNNTACYSYKCDTITVTIAKSPCDSLNAYFYYTNSGNTYTFENTSANNPKGSQGYWRFGDGSSIASGIPVIHTFPTSSIAVTYDVCFFVYLPNSTCPTDSFCRDITVPGTTIFPCDSLTAYFYPTESGNTYTFTSAKNPSGYHQYWTFGDGTSSTSSTSPVTHTYPSSSATISYNVCHIVYGPTSATCKPDTFCRTVTVPGATVGTCHANFTWAYGSGVRQINFTNTSTASDSITAYSWYFGDNTTSSSKNPSHYFTYNTATSYVVCMYITTSSGCRSEKCDTITFPKSPCDSLNAYYDYSDTGNAYYFFDPYLTNPKGYHGYWNFGDGSGTVSGGIPETHIFPATTAAVTYTVCFHVYLPNSTCPVDSFCRSITVAGTSGIPPCDSLTSKFDFTNTGNTFTFTSAHNPTGYHSFWNFGDGSSIGSGSPVTHTYPTSSATVTYTVCHYVYFPNATCKTDTTCEQVIVPGVSTTCNASFTYVIGSNGSVAFTDASTGGPTTWGWSFGDGSSGSPLQDPTHVYTASGTYKVCMYIVTASGCRSEHCDTIAINLTNPCNVNSNFQYAIHTTWVSFYPSQTSTNIHTLWTFGDGTTSTDSAAWITHSFPVNTAAVTYHVCHIVYSSSICADTTCENIVVPGTPTNSCKAYFTWAAGSNGSITFTDLSTSSDVITGWRWRFGDGDSSTAQSPTHAYATLGKYRVCLNITTAGGCTSEYCDTVTVSQTSPCTINSNFSYTNTGNDYTFTSVQNSTTVHQYWTFGDGTTGSGTPVSHTFAASTAAKTYTVCHIVYLPGTSCIDTTCKDITVAATNTGTCNANYTWVLSTTTAGEVTFTNTSTSSDSVVSWSWYFGDGSSASTFAATHTYAPGVYYACLRLLSASGCLSYHCDSIHIPSATNNCNAAFTYQLVGCDTVQFTNKSTGSYTHTAWNFGDGTSSSDPNPTHVFTAGTWTVTLYAYNPTTTCTSSSSQTITIQPCNVLNDTICGVVFSDNNGNGILDSTDAPYANIEVQVDNNVLYTDSFGHYSIVLPAGTHRVYVMIPSGCIATIPLAYNGSTGTYSYYVINGSAGGTFCGYNFGIDCNVDHICGKVFYDTNNNGIQDSSESGLANITILITGSNGNVHHAYTNTAGEFCETVPSGSYTITIDSSAYSTCIVTPLSINVNATGNGQSYIGNDFAVYCPPGAGDLDITVTPNSTVTPGFPAWYSVQVCNIGGSPMSGTATFFYDQSILAFNYSLPPQDASTGNTVSWNFTNLAPGQCLDYWVAFNATSPLTPGQPVYTVAIVTPAPGYTDANPKNNIDTLHQEVKASWDPNSKQAYQTNYSNPSYQVVSSVNPNQKIEYTINFQNDGNANAINIVVDDNLSPDLDANSFEMLSSSAPCVVTRNGSAVNIKFSNINLPPSSVNEPASHGFVKYAINSVNGLPAGHDIIDPATIYFDYNAPAMTGNADVIMLDVTGINEVKPAAIVIGPNPMSDYTQVTLEGSNAGSFKFRVMDMTGRIVSEQLSKGNTLMFNRDNLAAGMYSYYVIQNDVIVNIGKLVIE